MSEIRMSLLSNVDANIVVKNKLKTHNFEILSCEKLDSSGVPVGFLSATEKICIKYRTNGQEEELYLFIKKLPESTYHQKTITSSGAFRKEVILFEEFLNALIDKFDGNPFPTCYLARPDEIVVLNDLSKEGFSNVPLFDIFSVNHCSKALESLAKLHAASLAFEVKRGRKINEHIKILQEETIFTDDENSVTRKAVLVGLNVLRRIKMKYLPHYDEELTENVLKYLKNLHEKLGPSTKYPNVLSHSDLWTNNIMFRYTSQGDVAEACIIDFQLASYRPVAYDALMLLYLCTDKQLRDKHLKYLLEHYYSSLSKEMESEEMHLAQLLPYSEFKAMVNELHPVLLGIAPEFLHFVLMPDAILKDVLHDEGKWINYYEKDRSEYALKASAEYLSYRTRVVEALRELFEYFNKKKALLL